MQGNHRTLPTLDPPYRRRLTRRIVAARGIARIVQRGVSTNPRIAAASIGGFSRLGPNHEVPGPPDAGQPGVYDTCAAAYVRPRRSRTDAKMRYRPAGVEARTRAR